MRRLLLLRHARYAAVPGEIDPALSASGQADAATVGRFLRGEGLLPDLVLCSAARRARETCEAVLAAAEDRPARETDEAIRSGDEDALLRRLREVPDRHRTVLAIGHNPTMHGLARALATAGPAQLRDRLARGYAPCTLTVLELETDSWERTGRCEGVLHALFDPGTDAAAYRVPG